MTDEEHAARHAAYEAERNAAALTYVAGTPDGIRRVRERRDALAATLVQRRWLLAEAERDHGHLVEIVRRYEGVKLAEDIQRMQAECSANRNDERKEGK